VVNFTPLLLYPRGKSPRYKLDRRLDLALELIWTMWRRDNSWPYRDSNSDPSVIQHVAVAIPTELSRLISITNINIFFQKIKRNAFFRGHFCPSASDLLSQPNTFNNFFNSILEIVTKDVSKRWYSSILIHNKAYINCSQKWTFICISSSSSSSLGKQPLLSRNSRPWKIYVRLVYSVVI
jgi:hypothetical protein